MILNNRLLVVVNPAAKQQLALERAVPLAAATGAELRLQAVVYDPEFSDGIFNWDDDEHTLGRKAQLASAVEWLEETAATLDLERVSVRANWGHPLDEVVLTAVDEYDPDLVLLQPRAGPGGRLSLTEWRLLRECRVPLWLARAAGWPKSPQLLAAVDPSHADDKPASLDRQIIAWADGLSRTLGTGFRVLHAIGEIPSAIGIAQSPREYEKELRAIRTRRIEELLPQDLKGRVEIELSTIEPTQALLEICRHQDIDLVVMGMLARARLADLLIGSTARDFIPKCKCDVLLIKPDSE